jgi:DHA1 family multidrug resistance protein-like MFS transporter
LIDTLDLKVFGTLFFSIFAAVMGVGIVVPLLPVYAHELGASGLYIGLIFGSFSLSRTFLLTYFGRLSDTKGRKPFIVVGLFAYAMISVAFCLAGNVTALILIRFVQGIASAMIMPVVQAYVGEITPEGREGRVMGCFNLSLFIGLSIGPVIGGAVKEHFSLQTAFLCMGSLSLTGFLLSLVLLPPRRSERGFKVVQRSFTWKPILTDRTLGALAVFRFAYTACIGIIWGFLPVLADSEFRMEGSAIGILVMLGMLVSGLLQAPMGYLADRWNRKAMILGGGTLICLSLGFYFQAGDFSDLFLSGLIFGVGGGICMPPLMAIAVTKGHEVAAMGSVMALLTVAHSLGMLVGSTLAGLIMEIFQLRQAFVMGAVLMMAAMVVFSLATRRQFIDSPKRNPYGGSPCKSPINPLE